jgi:hypothetical protein
MVILEKKFDYLTKLHQKGKNENTIDPYVFPMAIMGLENVELNQKVMFHFWL